MKEAEADINIFTVASGHLYEVCLQVFARGCPSHSPFSGLPQS